MWIERSVHHRHCPAVITDASLTGCINTCAQAYRGCMDRWLPPATILACYAVRFVLSSRTQSLNLKSTSRRGFQSTRAGSIATVLCLPRPTQTQHSMNECAGARAVLFVFFASPRGIRGIPVHRTDLTTPPRVSFPLSSPQALLGVHGLAADRFSRPCR